MRIKVIEIYPFCEDGFALGVMVSWDAFIGVSFLLGWWRLNIGLRSIGI